MWKFSRIQWRVFDSKEFSSKSHDSSVLKKLCKGELHEVLNGVSKLLLMKVKRIASAFLQIRLSKCKIRKWICQVHQRQSMFSRQTLLTWLMPQVIRIAKVSLSEERSTTGLVKRHPATVCSKTRSRSCRDPLGAMVSTVYSHRLYKEARRSLIQMDLFRLITLVTALKLHSWT